MSANSSSSPVSYQDVLDALPRVHSVLDPTLLREWPGLSEIAGASIYIKHENHNPTGAFKVRGGLNLVASLDEGEKTRGFHGDDPYLR